ncbi:ACT domain-containing protein [Dubosiella muris]|uniref:ACT domain-containing protein n=1 Tax=Dubosiella muris TaxID=3038133 RepID=A0AC61R5I2_9FIRM|nr:ACT domain-containing protein [Dubosiella muris]TGY65254.1 ACT domain-containing protein [Dubosiella muris]
MKAVITVVGSDRVGILAMIANACAKHNVNVLDVSQTIVDGIFTMTMITDCSGVSDFEAFAQFMEVLGEENCLIVRVMNQDIFKAMHTI